MSPSWIFLYLGMLEKGTNSMLGDVFMSIDIKWDENANVWIAINDELGITLEDASYDKLIDRLKIAIPEMCKLNNINVSYVYIKTATRMITCTL